MPSYEISPLPEASDSEELIRSEDARENTSKMLDALNEEEVSEIK